MKAAATPTDTSHPACRVTVASQPQRTGGASSAVWRLHRSQSPPRCCACISSVQEHDQKTSQAPLSPGATPRPGAAPAAALGTHSEECVAVFPFRPDEALVAQRSPGTPRINDVCASDSHQVRHATGAQRRVSAGAGPSWVQGSRGIQTSKHVQGAKHLQRRQ